MDVELLKNVGQIAGIGGLALGVFLLLFRDIIRKNIFPTLVKKDAYRLLRLIAILVWSVAVLGIGAWVFAESGSTTVLGDNISADRSVVNTGTITGAPVNVDSGNGTHAD